MPLTVRVCVCVCVSHIQQSKWWGSKDCHCAYSDSWSDIVSSAKAQILVCKRMVELRATVRGICNVSFQQLKGWSVLNRHSKWIAKALVLVHHTQRADLNGFAFISMLRHLKGYSAVNLICGLTHRDTEWDPPHPERSSFPTSSLCSFSNLWKDRTITTHCSLCLQPRNRHQKATQSHK